MKHCLRSDTVRVLFEKPMTVSEIHSAIILLRLFELITGPIRKRFIFLLPRKRQIKWRLEKLAELEPSRVAKQGKKYRLTDRGVETYEWYMSKHINPKPRQPT